MSEFNLKEKRERLIKRASKGELDLKVVFEIIQKQDKEFILWLKEEFCKNFQLGGWICKKGMGITICDNCEEIDKLSGGLGSEDSSKENFSDNEEPCEEYVNMELLDKPVISMVTLEPSRSPSNQKEGKK